MAGVAIDLGTDKDQQRSLGPVVGHLFSKIFRFWISHLARIAVKTWYRYVPPMVAAVLLMRYKMRNERKGANMHTKSETELAALAEDFMNQHHGETNDVVRGLFMDEAMARHSRDDDGDRGQYFHRALAIFGEMVALNREQALV
jgi:hypothetical protein